MRTRLANFAIKNKFRGKGPLCVALVITDHAKTMGLPLNPDELVTQGEGQVLGLGKAKVQSILLRHNITRVLAEEGGRTSRGSIGNMRAYVAFLNEEHEKHAPVDLDVVEKFWIGQAQAFFSARPFSLRLDGTHGLRSMIRHLMEQAVKRQAEMPGTMFLGTMMQHLVGAKLDLVLKDGNIEHHSSNQNDTAEGRTGDFDIGDVSIHVSTAPGEALIRKCQGNLDASRRPVIVTTTKGAVAAEVLAGSAGIAERIDIVEFEQFIATNLYELSRFALEERRLRIEELISRYNAIVEEHETDPSLKIGLSGGR